MLSSQKGYTKVMDNDGPSGPPELGKPVKPPKSISVSDGADEKPVETPAETPEPQPEPAAEEPASAPEPAHAKDEIEESTMADEPDELNEHVREPGDPDGVVEKEERELEEQRRRNREAAERPYRDEPARGDSGSKNWLIAVPLLLLFLALPVGAFWYTSHKAKQPVNKTTNDTAQQSGNAQTSTQTKAPAVQTKHYDSTTYTLGFDYPETWKVSDTAAKLTVTSPAVDLTASDGSKQKAHVIVTIQNKQTNIPGYPGDGATAIDTSRLLVYRQPTTIQRAQTYLSTLGYRPNQIDALYVTGDNGYQKDQNVPMSDAVKGNPLISITFATCDKDDCSGTVTPLALAPSNWLTSSYATQVDDLILSLQLD